MFFACLCQLFVVVIGIGCARCGPLSESPVLVSDKRRRPHQIPSQKMECHHLSSSAPFHSSLLLLRRHAMVLLCAMVAVLSFNPSSMVANAVVFAENANLVEQHQQQPQFAHPDCAQLAGGDEERLLVCQLYESSALLTQLGMLINEGIGRLALNQGMGKLFVADTGREKRKHEYLRFGKRKHEYLRFGRK